MNALVDMRAGIVQPPSAELYKTVSSHWPSGVAVITTMARGGEPHGLTMSAVISLSLDPMQFLISVDRRSATLPWIKDSGRFCINFLERSQAEIGIRFAGKSADKFSSLKYRLSKTGLPVLDGAVSSIDCRVHSVSAGGDHEIIIGDVVDMEHFGGEPLVHFKRAFHTVVSAGH